MSLGLVNPMDTNATGWIQLSTTLSKNMTESSYVPPQSSISKVDIIGLKFNRKVLDFLNSNVDVFLRMSQISNAVNDVIGYDLQPVLEMIEDEESNDVSRLSFVYVIKNKTYDEILNIWDDVSKEVYKNMPINTSKKISIILHGE